MKNIKLKASNTLSTSRENNAKFLGLSLKTNQSANRDYRGNRVWDNDVLPMLKAVGATDFRVPEGSEAYSMDINDSFYRVDFPELLAAMPQSTHSVTFPPHWSVSDFLRKFDATRFSRISLGNEPVLHFKDGDEYVAWASGVYKEFIRKGIPEEKLYFQTAKPYFVDGVMPINERQRPKHKDFLDKAAAAVAKGDLPNRLVTTHKTPFTWVFSVPTYDFFKDYMVPQYRNYFNDDIKVGLTEFKVKDNGDDAMSKGSSRGTVQELVGTAEMLLALPRLHAEFNGMFDSMNFQVGWGRTFHSVIEYGDPTSNEATVDPGPMPEHFLRTLGLTYALLSEPLLQGNWLNLEPHNLNMVTEGFTAKAGNYLAYINYENEPVKTNLNANKIKEHYYIEFDSPTLMRFAKGELNVIPEKSVGVILFTI